MVLQAEAMTKFVLEYVNLGCLAIVSDGGLPDWDRD
jgi:hypothetical protein